MVFTMSLDNNASIFTAEACAIAKALLWLHEKGYTEDILILFDSLSVVLALNNNCINVYKNPHIIEIRNIHIYKTVKFYSNQPEKNYLRMDSGSFKHPG